MNRIKRLTAIQRALLILPFVLCVLFAFLYARTVGRVGFAYQGTIFVPVQSGEDVVYSGKLEGKDAFFTVSAHKRISFQHGDTSYGPYTATEDASAIPDDQQDMAEYMTGVELRQGDEVLFRGGILRTDEGDVFYPEADSGQLTDIIYVVNGVQHDTSGNVIDPLAPSAAVIWELMQGPTLTHRGDWGIYWIGLFLSVINAGYILFADELFRFRLSFQVRFPEDAEPSDWELAGRLIGEIIMCGMVFVILMIGLCAG